MVCCDATECAVPCCAHQELAWSSFSLIKNTNSCGVIIMSGDKAMLARGALGSSLVQAGQAQASLNAIAQVGCMHGMA